MEDIVLRQTAVDQRIGAPGVRIQVVADRIDGMVHVDLVAAGVTGETAYPVVNIDNIRMEAVDEEVQRLER